MKKLISIVISAYNEEGNVRELHKQLSAVAAKSPADMEFIFVDDGSTDRTLLFCNDMQKSDARVKIVRQTKNFGHEAAMLAGMEYARGDAVIFMDADLQHPPALIADMVKLWTRGEKIVLTKRAAMKDAGLVRRVGSWGFYFLLNFLSDVKIPKATPDFRLIDREYIEFLKRFDERDSLFRGTLSMITDTEKLPTLEFVAPARHAGETKYPFWKATKLALDSIFQFSTRPLQLALILAIIFGALGAGLGVYVILEKFVMGTRIPGYATIVSVVSFMSAVILFAISIVGIYIGKIHLEVKKRPLYFSEYYERKTKK